MEGRSRAGSCANVWVDVWEDEVVMLVKCDAVFWSVFQPAVHTRTPTPTYANLQHDAHSEFWRWMSSRPRCQTFHGRSEKGDIAGLTAAQQAGLIH